MPTGRPVFVFQVLSLLASGSGARISEAWPVGPPERGEGGNGGGVISDMTQLRTYGSDRCLTSKCPSTRLCPTDTPANGPFTVIVVGSAGKASSDCCNTPTAPRLAAPYIHRLLSALNLLVE